jgi:hypothetical protein
VTREKEERGEEEREAGELIKLIKMAMDGVLAMDGIL